MDGSEATASQATGAGSVGAQASPGAAAVEGQGAPPAWAVELADRLTDTVARVKARTTVKVVTALRAVVYGSVVLVAMVTAAILGTIGVVRIWDAYVPISPLGRRVWLGYVVVGGLFFLGGALVMSRRRASRHS